MNPYQNYQPQQQNPYMHYPNQQQPPQQQQYGLHYSGQSVPQQSQYGMHTSPVYSQSGQSHSSYAQQYPSSSSYGQNPQMSASSGMANLGPYSSSTMSPQYPYSSAPPQQNMSGFQHSWDPLHQQQQSQFITNPTIYDSHRKGGEMRRDHRNDGGGRKYDRDSRRRSPEHNRRRDNNDSLGFSSRRDQMRDDKVGIGHSYRHYIFSKVSQMPVTANSLRRFAELKARYPKMRVSSDFVSSHVFWIDNNLAPIIFENGNQPSQASNNSQDARSRYKKEQQKRIPIPPFVFPEDEIQVIFDNQTKKFASGSAESEQMEGKDHASLHEGVKHNIKLMLPLPVSLKTQFPPFFDALEQIDPTMDKGKLISMIDQSENAFFETNNTSGGQNQPNIFAAANHISKHFKFIVAKKDSSGIQAISGSWSKHKDGGDPHQDATIIKTAIRVGQEFLGIDLSVCEQWYKILEVWYDRPEEELSEGSKKTIPKFRERSVFLIPNWWDHFSVSALSEKFPQMWEDRKKTMEQVLDNMLKTSNPSTSSSASSSSIPGLSNVVNDREEHGRKDFLNSIQSELQEGAPQTPSVYITTPKNKLSAGIKVVQMSLQNLLEYSENEKSEKTFEVSLFAEIFAESLQYHYGKILFEECQKRWKSELSGSKKRIHSALDADNEQQQGESASNDEDIEAPPSKKQKISETSALETHQIPRKVKTEPEQQETPTRKTGDLDIDFVLLQAFRYFDKNACNFLYCDDIVRILHNECFDISHRQCKDLIYGITRHEKKMMMHELPVIKEL